MEDNMKENKRFKVFRVRALNLILFWPGQYYVHFWGIHFKKELVTGKYKRRKTSKHMRIRSED